MSKVALAVLLLVAGCGEARERDAAVAPVDPLAALTALRDQMCACPTEACADAVVEDVVALGERFRDGPHTDAREQATKVVVAALTECMLRVLER